MSKINQIERALQELEGESSKSYVTPTSIKRDMILKQVYFRLLETTEFPDYDGQLFSFLLELDSQFIYTFIDWCFSRKTKSRDFRDYPNFTFLWNREDYHQLMSSVARQIYEKEKGEFVINTFFLNFFTQNEAKSEKIKITDRQEEFLKKQIKDNYDNISFIHFIFSLVETFFESIQFSLLKTFLQHNNNFEDFKSIRLDPVIPSWTGSGVPYYEGRVTFFEELLSMLNKVEFLQHKQYIEQKIAFLREDVEKEKKRDFIGLDKLR